jgi:hypothetical protein
MCFHFSNPVQAVTILLAKISGQSYTDFVKDSILLPIGISDMQLAGAFGNPKKNEVTHYTDLTFPTHNREIGEEFCFARADAWSGWIASATNMLKLIVDINAVSSNNNILDSTSMRIMLTASKANEHFTCGWFINDDFKNRYYISQHFGQASEIVSAANGYSWVILLNASRPVAPDYLGAMDQIIWKVISNPVIKWP